MTKTCPPCPRDQRLPLFLFAGCAELGPPGRRALSEAENGSRSATPPEASGQGRLARGNGAGVGLIGFGLRSTTRAMDLRPRRGSRPSIAAAPRHDATRTVDASRPRPEACLRVRLGHGARAMTRGRHEVGVVGSVYQAAVLRVPNPPSFTLTPTTPRSCSPSSSRYLAGAQGVDRLVREHAPVLCDLLPDGCRRRFRRQRS